MGSGGLFQRVDHLLQDVRAVVGYLLENGIGKFLQLSIVPLTFLQLQLKLKGKGKTVSGPNCDSDCDRAKSDYSLTKKRHMCNFNKLQGSTGSNRAGWNRAQSHFHMDSVGVEFQEGPGR